MQCPIILGVEGEAREVLEDAKSRNSDHAGGCPATRRRDVASSPTIPRWRRAMARRGATSPPSISTAPGWRRVISSCSGKLRRGVRSNGRRADRRGRRPSVTGSSKWRRLARDDRLRAPCAAQPGVAPGQAQPAPSLFRPGRMARSARRSSLRMAAEPPLPLFPPRSGMIAKTSEGWAFTFLGRTHAMPGAVDWSAPSLAPRDQLWRMNLHYMEYLEEVDDSRVCRADRGLDRRESADTKGAPGETAGTATPCRCASSFGCSNWRCGAPRFRPPRCRGSWRAWPSRSRFSTDNLETDLGGNHLVKNIKGVGLGVRLFRRRRRGGMARRWACNGCDPALVEQVLPDGVHYERSPSYHAQVFADLMECRHGVDPAAAPAALDEALRAMAIATRISPIPTAGRRSSTMPDFTWPIRRANVSTPIKPCSATVRQRRRNFAFSTTGYFGRRDGGNYLVDRLRPDRARRAAGARPWRHPEFRVVGGG